MGQIVGATNGRFVIVAPIGQAAASSRARIRLSYEDAWRVGTFLDAMAYRDTLAIAAAEEDDHIEEVAANA